MVHGCMDKGSSSDRLPSCPLVTRPQIAADLRALGVRAGEILLVHSSLKSIGRVEGGAEAVLGALRDVLTPEGTLVLPTLSYSAINGENPRFDVRTTPSCVGHLTNVFRELPGVVRSLHPTHSLAAWGRDARALLADHELQRTPGGCGSPYEKIALRGGQILFLGTGLACNTMLHCVEEWAQVPDALTAHTQALQVVDYDGRVIPVAQHRHQGGHSRFYAKVEPLFARAGFMVEGKVGAARCHRVDAARMTEYVLKLLKDDPFFFTHDRIPEF